MPEPSRTWWLGRYQIFDNKNLNTYLQPQVFGSLSLIQVILFTWGSMEPIQHRNTVCFELKVNRFPELEMVLWTLYLLFSVYLWMPEPSRTWWLGRGWWCWRSRGWTRRPATPRSHVANQSQSPCTRFTSEMRRLGVYIMLSTMVVGGRLLGKKKIGKGMTSILLGYKLFRPPSHQYIRICVSGYSKGSNSV